MDKYAAGERTTPLVPIENIDRVPVSIMHDLSDYRCAWDYAEWIFHQIPTKEKYLIPKNIKHYSFARESDQGFRQQIEDMIDYGYILPGHYGDVQNVFLT